MSDGKDLLGTAVTGFVGDGDPTTDVALVAHVRPFSPRDLPATAEGAAAVAAAQFQLALLFNEVPLAAGDGRWEGSGRRVWQVYERFLTEAALPPVDFPEGAPAAFAEARAVLFEDEGMSVPSARLRAYREHKAAWETAQLQLTAGATGGDPEAGATQGAEASRAVERAAQAWAAVGHRAEVDNALAVMARAARTVPSAAWASALSDLRIAERANLAGGEYYSTQVLPIGFDLRRDGSWATITASGSTPTIPTDVLRGLSLGGGEVLEVELAALDIERSWLRLDLIARRDWRWSEAADPPLSDGQTPGGGLLPAVAERAVLMRHAVVTATTVEPDPGAFIEDSRHRLHLVTAAEGFDGTHFARAFHERYRQKPPYRLRVRSPAGAPLEGALVTFGMSALQKRGDRRRWFPHHTRTDASGLAEVPNIWWAGGEGEVQEGRFRVAAEGYETVFVNTKDWAARLAEGRASSGVDLIVTLHALPTIAVRIVTALPLSGRRVPLTGARVQLVAPEGGAEFAAGRIHAACTDADGWVRCRHPYASVETDTLVIAVDADGYRPLASPVLQHRGPLRTGETFEAELEVTSLTRALTPDKQSCRLVAFVTRRLPMAPDPDPSLPWPPAT